MQAAVVLNLSDYTMHCLAPLVVMSFTCDQLQVVMTACRHSPLAHMGHSTRLLCLHLPNACCGHDHEFTKRLLYLASSQQRNQNKDCFDL